MVVKAAEFVAQHGEVMPIHQPTPGRKQHLRRDDYTRVVERFLDQHNIRTYRIEHYGKHRTLTVELGGRIVKMCFPLTGSDWRGTKRTVTRLRRVLGLVGGMKAAPQ
jgi:hypothetical protein